MTDEMTPTLTPEQDRVMALFGFVANQTPQLAAAATGLTRSEFDRALQHLVDIGFISAGGDQRRVN